MFFWQEMVGKVLQYITQAKEKIKIILNAQNFCYLIEQILL